MSFIISLASSNILFWNDAAKQGRTRADAIYEEERAERNRKKDKEEEHPTKRKHLIPLDVFNFDL